MTYRNLSIQQKLRLIIMATVGVALMLACAAAFLTYDQLAFRDSMKSDLDVLADIFGSSSTAALSFGDRKDGSAILAELRAKRSITRADFYSANGKPFAEYVRDKWMTLPAMLRVRADSSSVRRQPAQTVQFKHIALDNQSIGGTYLKSDLDALRTRGWARFTEIVMGVLFLSSLFALALSARLQRIISGPIAHLAATARTISLQKDYSGRAVKESDDELGQLIDTFNEMLTEIESRDHAVARLNTRIVWNPRSMRGQPNW